MRLSLIELGKVASDLRLLSMGSARRHREIALPAVQPGSSIMPGKVNPSIPEMVNQVLSSHGLRHHGGDGVRSGQLRSMS
jgi:aspartate ammonia-lyase